MEIGIACATFGPILASLMGGPIATFLIARHDLKPAMALIADISLGTFLAMSLWIRQLGYRTCLPWRLNSCTANRRI